MLTLLHFLSSLTYLGSQHTCVHCDVLSVDSDLEIGELKELSSCMLSFNQMSNLPPYLLYLHIDN